MSSFLIVSSSFAPLVKSDLRDSGRVYSSSTRTHSKFHPYKSSPALHNSNAVQKMRMERTRVYLIELERQRLWRENPDAVLPVGVGMKTLEVLEQEHS